MINKNYAKAYAEIDVIIENALTDLIDQIPKSFIKFIKDNKQNDYSFRYDNSKPLHEQNMMDETRTILTIIYRDFLCSQEERKEINDILVENDNKYNQELEEKYNTDLLFKGNKKENNISTFQQLVIYDENKNIFHKLKKFLDKIFKNGRKPTI